MSKFQKLVEEKREKWAKILREALKKQSRQGEALAERERIKREEDKATKTTVN